MSLPQRLEAMATGPAAHEPADPEAVRAVEEELGFDLPADYVAFLLRSNGFDIDVDPVVESRFRLNEIETIVDESHGYGFDVRDQQVVLVGSDGGPFGYGIDFRFKPVQFVRVSYYDHDRRRFDYLGDTLEAFVENVLSDTRLKKPKGLTKRKKKPQLPNKVDPKRRPDAPGLARIFKDHWSETVEPGLFLADRGEFVFRASQGSFSLDPENGKPSPLPGEASRLYPPYVFYAPRNSLIGKSYDHERHEWSVGEFSLESGELVGTFDNDPRVLPFSMMLGPDGRTLAVAARDFAQRFHDPEGAIPGTALFDVETREPRHRFFSWQDGAPGVTIDDDGVLIQVSTRLEGDRAPFRPIREILFRSIETGNVVRAIELAESFHRIYWLRRARTGQLLAVDGEFMLCEIRDDGTLTHPIGPRRLGEATSLELVGDDRVLIGTGAGSLHLFELTSGTELWSDRHRRGGCSSLAVSADERWALTGGYDAGPTRLWRLPDR